MQKYKNLDGDSGVEEFETGSDRITVKFKGGAEYTYTNQSAGAENVRQAVALAEGGEGLNAFIMKNMRTKYASKSR